MPEKLILVDEKDNPVGIEDKLKAHQEGKLHRAFSIFVFSSQKQLLLQQRALGKYHSASLWTNTCCSHPRPNEETLTAGHRRLKEEMGFDCELKELFSFVYRTDFENGLIEHELDHVLIGYYDKEPIPNPEEVQDYKWVDTDWLQKDMLENPDSYTFWLKISLEKVLKKVNI